MSEGVLESYIETKTVERAKARGWESRKLSYIGRDSAPDRFFFDPIRQRPPRFVEFKRKGEKPTLKQEREHTRLRNAGLEVYVVDSVEQGYELFSD